MTAVRRFDHVGITIADLDLAIGFFQSIGLELDGRTMIEGEFIDTVIGIPGARSEIAMMRAPGGDTAIELSTFLRPAHLPGSPAAPSNELGIRNVAFEVDDLRGLVAQLAADGYGLLGGIGQHEDSWLMAYVRGPEGILVALAERLS